MPTQVSVMNSVLRVLGEPMVADYEDTGKYARQIRNTWESAVDNCFEEHDWRSFTTVTTLSAVANMPTGWSYAFSLPANFDRLILINNSEHRRDLSIPYEIRDGQILTNSETTYCWYINGRHKTSLGAWSQKFADYVAYHIASELYPTTDETRSVMERIEMKLKKAKLDAKAYDRRFQPVQKVPPSEYVRARSAGIRGIGRYYGR